jgi:outer membrane protein TolC
MKTILLAWVFAAMAFAQHYTLFEKEVLAASPYLKASEIDIALARLEGEILQRYDNPELSVGLGGYDPDNDEAFETGGYLQVAQPLRVPGFGDALARYATALQKRSDATYREKKALFVLGLRAAYLHWTARIKEALIAGEAVAIARRLETIAKARWQEGADTKARLMQAAIEVQKAEAAHLNAEAKALEALEKFSAMTGLTDISIPEAAFLYDERTLPPHDPPHNPAFDRLEAETALLDADIRRQSFAITRWNLEAEFEQEPDQSITRIGAEIPLPVFNTNRQERQMAKLRLSKKILARQRLDAEQRQRLGHLHARLKVLHRNETRLLQTARATEKLLTLFEEGYKETRSSLLELIAARNDLLAVRQALLETRLEINLVRLHIDYLQGKLP